MHQLDDPALQLDDTIDPQTPSLFARRSLDQVSHPWHHQHFDRMIICLSGFSGTLLDI